MGPENDAAMNARKGTADSDAHQLNRVSQRKVARMAACCIWQTIGHTPRFRPHPGQAYRVGKCFSDRPSTSWLRRVRVSNWRDDGADCCARFADQPGRYSKLVMNPSCKDLALRFLLLNLVGVASSALRRSPMCGAPDLPGFRVNAQRTGRSSYKHRLLFRAK